MKKLYTISVNLDREKQEELIKWIQIMSDEEGRSLSSFCISIIKEYKKQWEQSGQQSRRSICAVEK